MARKQRKQADDDSPGPGSWIVTFSDCMTLLLCFFVMLVSFSSFDDVSLNRLAGAFEHRSFGFIWPIRRTVKDSVVPPRDRQIDHTETGSDKPTDELPKPIKNPQASAEIADADAFRDKKICYVPSRWVFWGNGCSLTPSGRDCLNRIASFMKMVPCYAIISELPGLDDEKSGEATLRKRGLERSWTVMQHFKAGRGVPAKRLHIAAARRMAPSRFGGQSVMQITLMARNLYE